MFQLILLFVISNANFIEISSFSLQYDDTQIIKEETNTVGSIQLSDKPNLQFDIIHIKAENCPKQVVNDMLTLWNQNHLGQFTIKGKFDNIQLTLQKGKIQQKEVEYFISSLQNNKWLIEAFIGTHTIAFGFQILDDHQNDLFDEKRFSVDQFY